MALFKKKNTQKKYIKEHHFMFVEVPFDQVAERTIPLVRKIRSIWSKTPIILVENPINDQYEFSAKVKDGIDQKNKALKEEYDKIIREGISEVYFLSTTRALGDDHDATVDGVHFTDVGYIRYANFLIQALDNAGIKLVNK